MILFLKRLLIFLYEFFNTHLIFHLLMIILCVLEIHFHYKAEIINCGSFLHLKYLFQIIPYDTYFRNEGFIVFLKLMNSLFFYSFIYVHLNMFYIILQNVGKNYHFVRIDIYFSIYYLNYSENIITNNKSFEIYPQIMIVLETLYTTYRR